jgi:hypothetical protein
MGLGFSTDVDVTENKKPGPTRSLEDRGLTLEGE